MMIGVSKIDININDSESESQYIWRMCSAKDNGLLDITWDDLAEILNSNLYKDESDWLSSSAYRKQYQYANKYYEEVFSKMKYTTDLDVKLNDIRKERIKLQTANLERNRYERNVARHELYYENVANVIKTLPLPDFKPIYVDSHKIEYMLVLSDLHYGATFQSINNNYSPEEAKRRLEFLLGQTIQFVKDKKICKINVVSLGDTIQGIIRISDLKINDSSIMRTTVEVSRLLAQFINELSSVCDVDYYHVPTANHTQIRPLGTKASELADEDLEYLIGNYIKDLCKDNKRINVHLTDENAQFIHINMKQLNIVAGHGHTIKNLNNSLRDLSCLMNETIDYLLLGHFHGDKNFSVNESINNDCEVIVAPSIVGSDPYSDKIMKGSKSSAKIFGFSKNGLVEQYKYILN